MLKMKIQIYKNRIVSYIIKMTFCKKTVIFIFFWYMISKYRNNIQQQEEKTPRNEIHEQNTKESKWKNEDKTYLFELQKFLDIVENVKDEELQKEIITQMLKCDKRVTQLAETIFQKLEKNSDTV